MISSSGTGQMLRIFTPVALLLCSLTALPQTIQGEVIAVIDGNTLQVTSPDLERYQIILLGIDCPELTQDFGKDAKSFTEARLLHERVVVHLYGKDRYKNYIGVALTRDSTDVRMMLLQEGLAWTSERNPIDQLEVIRKEATSERKGLWIYDDPIPPWLHRRQISMSAPKSR
jgi:micrococcal nuclease